MVHASQKYSQLNVLFEKVFSSKATSAPVERVFSSSGLLMRPHHARMTNYIIIRACLSDLHDKTRISSSVVTSVTVTATDYN